MLEGSDALYALRDDWQRIYSGIGQRQVHHSWQAHVAFAEHLLSSGEAMRFFVLRGPSRIELICPLMSKHYRRRGISVRTWRMLNHRLWPYADVISDNEEARRDVIPLLIESLKRSPGRAMLALLGPCQDPAFWNGLTQIPQREQRCFLDSAYVFDCNVTHDHLVRRTTKSHRKNLTRRWRRLNEQFVVKCVRETRDSPRQLDEAFAAFLRLEASGWKGAQGTRSAIALDHSSTEYCRALTRLSESGDGCEVALLTVNGRCIVAELSFRTGSTFATLKAAYDEEFARFSPGHQLLNLTLKRCCDDPHIARYHQMSHADWLHQWRPDTISLPRAHVALTPAARIALWAVRRASALTPRKGATARPHE